MQECRIRQLNLTRNNKDITRKIMLFLAVGQLFLTTMVSGQACSAIQPCINSTEASLVSATDPGQYPGQ